MHFIPIAWSFSFHNYIWKDTDDCAGICLRFIIKVVGTNGSEFEDRVAQVIKQVTDEGVTQGDANRKLDTVPARMLPLSTASWPLPTPAYISNSTPVVHWWSTMTSTHSSINPIPWPPTSLSPKRQHSSQGKCSRSTTPLANNTLPSSFKQITSRHVHTSSSLTSVSTASNDICRTFSPFGLPPSSGGCPSSQLHCHARSLPIDNFGRDEPRHSSPNNNDQTLNTCCSDLNIFVDPTSFLPTPHSNGNGNDSDSDLEDLKDHSMMSSMMLLEILDGLNVLQRANADLDMEAEYMLQHKISKDNLGLEEIQPNMLLPIIHAPINPTSPSILSNNEEV